ncbi:MAG: efflux transporter, family, subunit [Firmicutes bacterium]|nr:efflux transporter, family, subunit [Bacillota bacterium]
MRTKLSIILAVLSILITVSGCSSKVKPGTASVNRPEVSEVIIVKLEKSTAADYYETSGTLQAKTVSIIASKVMGTVTSVAVKEGDWVDAGQVLANLEDCDLSARQSAAQAGYREALKAVELASQNKSLAMVTYQRYQQLYRDKAISQQEMDQIENQSRVADLEVERANEAANRAQAEASSYSGLTRLVAPVSGVVTAKKIDLGSTAVPGVSLFTVEDTSAFRLETDVDESFAKYVSLGMKVDVVVDALGKALSGTVAEISPAVDAASRKLHIKVNVAGEGLKSGNYARVRFPIGNKSGLFLPVSAVVEKGELSGVYVVGTDGTVTYRIVRLGKTFGAQVEILSGLDAGEKVIVEGLDRAVDGGVVREGNSQ